MRKVNVGTYHLHGLSGVASSPWLSPFWSSRVNVDFGQMLQTAETFPRPHHGGGTHVDMQRILHRAPPFGNNPESNFSIVFQVLNTADCCMTGITTNKVSRQPTNQVNKQASKHKQAATHTHNHNAHARANVATYDRTNWNWAFDQLDLSASLSVAKVRGSNQNPMMLPTCSLE